MADKFIGFYAPDRLKTALQAIARNRQLSLSALLRVVLEKFAADAEETKE